MCHMTTRVTSVSTLQITLPHIPNLQKSYEAKLDAAAPRKLFCSFYSLLYNPPPTPSSLSLDDKNNTVNFQVLPHHTTATLPSLAPHNC